MFILRGMLEKLSYKKCWECCWIVAKVVQGSSLDVMGAVAFLVVVKSHINDNNTSISNLIELLKDF